ncbi:unnamed protein product [Lactuca saligna]|uniref:Uncharacterized protein n=1 Tax=Lactuca saligna TaxID=75948 RepID=A0AA35YUC3_LACSI|nr:unnamed protein product [Lactuca saligna]
MLIKHGSDMQVVDRYKEDPLHSAMMLEQAFYYCYFLAKPITLTTTASFWICNPTDSIAIPYRSTASYNFFFLYMFHLTVDFALHRIASIDLEEVTTGGDQIRSKPKSGKMAALDSF